MLSATGWNKAAGTQFLPSPCGKNLSIIVRQQDQGAGTV